MAVLNRLLTAEDLLRMPQESIRSDLMRGELIRMTPAGARHGQIAIKFGAKQVIVRASRPATGHPGARRFARPLNGGLAFLFAFALDSPRRSKGGDETMKLYLFFVLMDTMILLLYPIVFIVSKLRGITKNKR